MHRGYTCVWRKVWANRVLIEPGRRFSRLEAWLYLINCLASGVDDRSSGLGRGEFKVSIRRIAAVWNWSPAAVFRFFRLLEENRMISRVKHSTEQEAERFIVCNYSTYNPERNIQRDTERNTNKEVLKESKSKKDTPAPAGAGACVSPKILVEIYQQHNQALPEVKALTAERLRKCRSRIDQAVRDGCLEQYLADFVAAVKKAQSTPFLRGEGARGWRASFDWFVANQVHIYAVLEGKYDGPSAGPHKGKGGFRGNDGECFVCDPGAAPDRRTSRGDPIYVPRQ